MAYSAPGAGFDRVAPPELLLQLDSAGSPDSHTVVRYRDGRFW